MDIEKEYELLSDLESKTTATRHSTFTAILGISFVLPGLAVQATNTCPVTILGLPTSLGSIVFFLGFVFYVFAVFHYHWYHRHAHAYRKRLKEMEAQMGISVYSLRTRPTIGPFKMHFEWALEIILVLYGVATLVFVGWKVFLVGLAALIIPYVLLVLSSARAPVEPLERGGGHS